MTKDDILRMAREAGMHDPMIFIGAYERFANLVYAAAAGMEREACARVCETPIDEVQITDDCAEVVYMDATECAAAIRARGNT
jgi:hypothetical protein